MKLKDPASIEAPQASFHQYHYKKNGTFRRNFSHRIISVGKVLVSNGIFRQIISHRKCLRYWRNFPMKKIPLEKLYYQWILAHGFGSVGNNSQDKEATLASSVFSLCINSDLTHCSTPWVHVPPLSQPPGRH